MANYDRGGFLFEEIPYNALPERSWQRQEHTRGRKFPAGHAKEWPAIVSSGRGVKVLVGQHAVGLEATHEKAQLRVVQASSGEVAVDNQLISTEEEAA